MIFLLLYLLVGVFGSVTQILLADSTTDFTNVQGNNGWNYNYYDEYKNYQQFPNFGSNPLGVPNNWLISGSYCRINSNAMHDNSPNACGSPTYGWCYPSLLWTNLNYAYSEFLVTVVISEIDATTQKPVVEEIRNKIDSI